MPVLRDKARQALSGIAASPGFAIGPLWMPEKNIAAKYQLKANPELEIQAFLQATNIALQEVETLVSTSLGPAKTILEFQIAILNDEAFLDAVLTQIKNGHSAFAAWNAAMVSEIQSYLQSNHDTFRSKASDFEDIKSRVCRVLCAENLQTIPNGVIVLADSLTPSQFIAHDWNSGGLALRHGSTASHVAILARQFGVPMLVKLQQGCDNLNTGEKAVLVVNATSGRMIMSPNQNDEIPPVASKTKAAGTAVPKFGNQQVSIMVNLAHLRELEKISIAEIDGIGLVRTEFLFDGAHANEEVQFQAYCRILQWAKGKPVYIRTIDAGGDKPVFGFSGVTSKLRGIKLSLANPEQFSVQIRALLRAAPFGNLHVTLPMVATETDLNDALALFETEAIKFRISGISYALPPIGIMVEVPAVAMTLNWFSKAQHFAIGTNDLIQYTLAEPRDNASQPSTIDNPAILALIKDVVSVGKALNKPVSVCGDAASDKTAVTHLLAAGVRAFSVSPPSRALIYDAIHGYIESGRI